VELFWTSKKRINGLKHFVVINQYKLKEEEYLDFVSVLDDSINFKISKKVFEDSNQWIKGWNNNEKEKIDFKEYQKFKSEINKDNLSKISLSETSQFNIS
tara:strand:+ start:581 stop:880 length:300 start_codon:yes stop_codon:yes gene_type:complete